MHIHLSIKAVYQNIYINNCLEFQELTKHSKTSWKNRCWDIFMLTNFCCKFLQKIYIENLMLTILS